MIVLIDKALELLGMPRVERCAKRSARWPSLRKAHLAAHPACAACGDRRGNAKEVHHIEPVHYDPSRELDPANLLTLCADFCHITWGHFGDWRLRNPGVVEDCRSFGARRAAARDDYLALAVTHGQGPPGVG